MSDTPRNRGLGFEGLAQAERALILAASAFVSLLEEAKEDPEGCLLPTFLRREIIDWLKVYSPDAEWPGKERA